MSQGEHPLAICVRSGRGERGGGASLASPIAEERENPEGGKRREGTGGQSGGEEERGGEERVKQGRGEERGRECADDTHLQSSPQGPQVRHVQEVGVLVSRLAGLRHEPFEPAQESSGRSEP